jgi:hypothetical protein
MENKCIVIVLGHSSIDIHQEAKRAVIPIQTILLADPGLECFAENLELQSDIVEMFLDSRFDFFNRSPEEILAELNRRVKSELVSEEFRLSKKMRTEEDTARIQFLQSSGVISHSAPVYHDKKWVFSSPNGPEQYGCVLLIHRGPDGLIMEKRYEEEIMTGVFELTKLELVDELSEDYDSLLFLDIGCNTTNGDPHEFRRRRIFGGKTRKYRKIKLYSMESKDGKMPSGPRTKAEAMQGYRNELAQLEPGQRTAVHALFNMRTQPAEVDKHGNIIQPKKPKGGRSRRTSRRTKRTRRR